MAAPVGHARTHAAPPAWPLHMSHFTAFLDSDLSCDLASTPGSSPIPSNSHCTRLGALRSGSMRPIWMTPYGQLRSQLPQPMQLSSMKTSPLGARWIASGGQSFMQSGCSQWRHDVGTSSCAYLVPAPPS